MVAALHNLHVLLLKKRGVERSDASGDGKMFEWSIAQKREGQNRLCQCLYRTMAQSVQLRNSVSFLRTQKGTNLNRPREGARRENMT